MVLLGIGEIITRIVVDRGPYFSMADLDKELGWRTKAHYSEPKLIHLKTGDSYEVEYETGEHGFRPFGDLNTSRKKLFVLGDSYTQAVEANNGATYADQLADSLDVELFCYGMAGYGSFQQLLFLREYVDIIKPDMLLLQVCDNDFVDNYAALEYESNYKVGEKRPYLHMDGKTTFERPVPIWQRITDKSEFLKLLRKKFQTSFARKKYAQHHITELGKGYELYTDAIAITDKIMAEIKNELDERNIPMAVLVAGYTEPYITHMREICEQNSITCLTKPAATLRKMEYGNQPVRCADLHHWSELGHKYMADMIQDTVGIIMDLKLNDSE